MKTSIRPFACVLCLAVALSLSACEGGSLGAREKGALGGAGLGAGLGAIVGHSVGSTGAGIAIGSAFGALSGAVLGNSIDNTDAQLDSNEQRLAAQDRQLQENRRLIDELRGRGADARISDRGVVVNVPDVLFEFGSARLTSEARHTAAEVADIISKTPGRHVAIEGHTDSVGTLEYNQKLSEDRAHSVAAELASEGVPRGRMSTRGYGETKPLASNKSDAGRARNRRVEIIIENRA